MKTKFYSTFETLCRNKGITPTQVCKDLDLSHGSVTHWKSGKLPRIETLEQISKYFCVPVTTLFTGVNKNSLYTTNIPVYGDVSCGSGVLADDTIIEYSTVGRQLQDPENYFILVAKGVSMMPKIENGDRVLIHKEQIIEPGQIGVFLIDGVEGLLKKFNRTPNSIQLISLNQMFPPLVFTDQNITRVQIIGRAVGLSRNL